jgi:hypothetical protein
MQLTDQLQGFTLVVLNGPTSVSYSLPPFPEHCYTSILSMVSGSFSTETMASLQNFIHDYSLLHDPASVPQKKEHSVLITDRLDSTDEQTHLYRCLVSNMVNQTIDTLSLTQLSQIICQLVEEGISVVSRHRYSVISLQMTTM